MTRFIPDYITELSMCEIFVFGSNLEGEHNGGAARTAYEKFGAEWGVGNGPTGQCYAIPTMDIGLDTIKRYIDEFIEFAREHPNNRFLVTRIGCGIAGFTDKEMAPLFKEARDLPNVNFPRKWLRILDHDKFVDAVIFGVIPEEPVVSIPEALTERDLKRLCKEYKYIIGSAVRAPKPNIGIRYVIDTNRFGYAEFGDFYICDDGELYVWTRDKTLASAHNQNMVECIFEDECKHRNRYFIKVIFAGVKTPYVDCNGSHIYTGDVLRIWLEGDYCTKSGNFEDEYAMLLAFGTLGWNEKDEEEWYARYVFKLDNHSVTPCMCARMERCGTVFYQLDWDEKPIEVELRCNTFQDIYNSSGLKMKDKEVLAKYTPNFDKDLWKYHAREIIGAEFNLK